MHGGQHERECSSILATAENEIQHKYSKQCRTWIQPFTNGKHKHTSNRTHIHMQRLICGDGKTHIHAWWQTTCFCAPTFNLTLKGDRLTERSCNKKTIENNLHKQYNLATYSPTNRPIGNFVPYGPRCWQSGACRRPKKKTVNGVNNLEINRTTHNRRLRLHNNQSIVCSLTNHANEQVTESLTISQLPLKGWRSQNGPWLMNNFRMSTNR